jgi:hypothetical protein
MSGPANSILVEPAEGQRRIREAQAGEADILPGMLLERDANGEYVSHVGAGLNAQKLFALENLADAKGIEDTYADNDRVRAVYAQPGDLINAALAASAAAIIIGSYLESSGDGFLRIATADAATDTAQRVGLVAVATEAVDNSSGPEGTRILVEVL